MNDSTNTIEGVMSFPGVRVYYGFKGVFVYVVILILTSIIYTIIQYRAMIPLDFDIFIIPAIVMLFVAYGIGYMIAVLRRVDFKRVRFEMQLSKKRIKVYFDDKEVMDETDFVFKGSIVSADNNLSYGPSFCLRIENNIGIGKWFKEIIPGRTQDVENTSVTFSNYDQCYNAPKGVEPYPGFISRVYHVLKEMQIEGLPSKTSYINNGDLQPFITTATKVYEKAESANLKRWNELVDINYRSEMYNLTEFRNNPEYLALDEIEQSAFDDVKGKDLLHLQCHFGMSTLGFARMGANVTGVDFSDKAIETARSIANDLSLKATFVCSNIFDLRQNLEEHFDCIFTSYGVLCWLRDLKEWGRIIAHFLKPGGKFFIVEFHPFANVFDDEIQDMRIRYPYFTGGIPEHFKNDYSYADDTIIQNVDAYEWTHDLGEIMGSLLSAGLSICEYKEYDYCCYQKFPFMNRIKRGEYRIEGDPIPLMFSIKAEKPNR